MSRGANMAGLGWNGECVFSTQGCERPLLESADVEMIMVGRNHSDDEGYSTRVICS